MLPVIQHKFPGPLPPTYNNRGKKALDEIFVTKNVEIVKCGYMQHSILTSDHCPIWVEVTKKSAFGSKMETTHKPKARRLKTNNPDIVDKYNQVLEEELNKRNVYQRSLNLYKNFQNPLTKFQTKLYKQIDSARIEAMAIAERKCRKLHMGAVTWSPTIQKARDKIY